MEPAGPEPVLPPPLPAPRIRCPLHDAIMQRETSLWRTSALVAASAPLMRFLRLRAEIKPVTHRVYNAAFSQPDGGVLAAAGGQGRITVYPTLSLSSYNLRDPASQALRPHISFTGAHHHHHHAHTRTHSHPDVHMFVKRLDLSPLLLRSLTCLCLSRSARRLGVRRSLCRDARRAAPPELLQRWRRVLLAPEGVEWGCALTEPSRDRR